MEQIDTMKNQRYNVIIFTQTGEEIKEIQKRLKGLTYSMQLERTDACY